MADLGLANVPTMGDRIPNEPFATGIVADRPQLINDTDLPHIQTQGGGGGIRFKIRKEGEWVDVS